MTDSTDTNTLRMSVAVPLDYDDNGKRALDDSSMYRIKQALARQGKISIGITRHSTYQLLVNAEWISTDDLSNNDLAALAEVSWSPKRETWHYVVETCMAYVVAVVADTAQKAKTYAMHVWPELPATLRVIAIIDRSDLTKLYGHQGVPLVVDPSATPLVWHREVQYHVRCGRVTVVSESTG